MAARSAHEVVAQSGLDSLMDTVCMYVAHRDRSSRIMAGAIIVRS